MKHPEQLAATLGLVIVTLASATTTTCQACDGSTIGAWRRTFYAYYALDYPLQPYFVPRMPGDCGRDANSCYGNFTNGSYDLTQGMPAAISGYYLPEDAAVLEPASFERLGQVPNDLGEAGAASR